MVRQIYRQAGVAVLQVTYHPIKVAIAAHKPVEKHHNWAPTSLPVVELKQVSLRRGHYRPVG